MKFKLLRYIWDKVVFFLIELDLKDLNLDWENTYDVIFDEYSDKDFKLLDDILCSIGEEWKPFKIDEVESRLATGQMLFTAKKNGKIIGFFWVATNYIDVLMFHAALRLNKDEAYDYNTYILEEYRGKNIHKGLKIYALSVLRQKGYKKIYGYIKNTNQRSLSAHEKLGYRIIGKTTKTRIMTLEFRHHNFTTEKIVFQGGPFHLWKVLFGKAKKNIDKTAASDL